MIQGQCLSNVGRRDSEGEKAPMDVMTYTDVASALDISGNQDSLSLRQLKITDFKGKIR